MLCAAQITKMKIQFSLRALLLASICAALIGLLIRANFQLAELTLENETLREKFAFPRIQDESRIYIGRMFSNRMIQWRIFIPKECKSSFFVSVRNKSLGSGEKYKKEHAIALNSGENLISMDVSNNKEFVAKISKGDDEWDCRGMKLENPSIFFGNIDKNGYFKSAEVQLYKYVSTELGSDSELQVWVKPTASTPNQ